MTATLQTPDIDAAGMADRNAAFLTSKGIHQHTLKACPDELRLG